MKNQVITIDNLSAIITTIKIDNKISKSIKLGIKEIHEISSGNVNQVFKVLFNDGFSCVAKYAPPFAYRYQDIAINNDRNAFEVAVLSHFFNKNNKNYPEVYCYSDEEHLMLMQDLSTCYDMREALIQGEVFNDFSDNLVRIFSLYPRNITSNQKAGNTKFTFNQGIYELQDITKNFVFQCPFGLKYPDGFVCLEENLVWVKENIFNNICVMNIRTDLEKIYNSKFETLLHGDLHTGSIMISHENTYIIDPEFSKVGPISFDIGMLLGNLIMSLISSNYHLKNNVYKKTIFQDWLLNCIPSLWNSTIESLHNNGFNKSTLLYETGGYCGIEIIRRIIGAAQIKDFISITDHALRATLELDALKIAVWLLENSSEENFMEKLLIKLKTIN